MGWYCVSDTLTLRPDTVLIGLNPSATVINLPDKTPAFQGPGEPKPIIEAPKGGDQYRHGHRRLYRRDQFPRRRREMDGRGEFHDERRPPAWRARHKGSRRTRRLRQARQSRGMEQPVRKPLGHRWRRRDLQGHLDAQPLRTGRDAHFGYLHQRPGVRDVPGAPRPQRDDPSQRSPTGDSTRCNSRRNGKKARRPCPWRSTVRSDIQFANTFFYRVISCFVPFPYATKVSESRDIRFRNVHCYSNSKVSFDSTIFDATAKAEVRDSEFALLDISGDSLRSRSRNQAQQSSLTERRSRNSPTGS